MVTSNRGLNTGKGTKGDLLGVNLHLLWGIPYAKDAIVWWRSFNLHKTTSPRCSNCLHLVRRRTRDTNHPSFRTTEPNWKVSRGGFLHQGGGDWRTGRGGKCSVFGGWTGFSREGATHRSRMFLQWKLETHFYQKKKKKRDQTRNRNCLQMSKSTRDSSDVFDGNPRCEKTRMKFSPLKLWQRFPAVWSLLVHRPPPSSSLSNDASAAMHSGSGGSNPRARESSETEINLRLNYFCVPLWALKVYI